EIDADVDQHGEHDEQQHRGGRPEAELVEHPDLLPQEIGPRLRGGARPPEGRRTTGANILSASIGRMIPAITMAGLSSGSCTRQKICQGVAPMTRAALVSWRGRAEDPARKNRK